MKIKITTLDMINTGELIASVDDEEITQEEINSAYVSDEQDWQVVRGRRGHADIGELLLEAYDGSREWVRVTWEGLVWQCVEEDGTPVVASDEN